MTAIDDRVASTAPHAPSGEAHNALALEFTATIEQLIACDQLASAEALARQMVGLLPAEGYGWKTLAFACLQRGDLSGAYEPLRQTLILLPASTELLQFWPEVSAAHERALAAAAGAASTTTRVQPTREQGEAAITLFNSGRVAEAERAAHTLIEAFPQHPLGWKIRGIALYKLGRHKESEPVIHRAHELIQDDPDVLQVYAGLLVANRRYQDAETLCCRLLEVRPGHAEGTRLLGVALMGAERVAEAEPFLLQAAQISPDSAMAFNSLGSLYLRQGRLSEAIAHFRRSLEISPDGDGTWSNLLFCMTHSENIAPAELFAEHLRYAAQFEAPYRGHWPHHANTREPERMLRVGFVSGDLHRHAVTNFIEPLLPHLARDAGLRLYAYSNTMRQDDVTQRVRAHFAVWCDIADLDDVAFYKQVLADKIDILIDLSGHTGYNRMPVFARKPAPLQASWIGYPGTTGLAAVDYYFADRFWAPAAQFRDQFSEKLVYLPALAPFQSEASAPPPNALPALTNGYLTFGSFNRVNKLRHEVIALWAQLLRALPDARLKIAAMPADSSAETQLTAWFAEEGIARARLDFHPRTSVVEFLRLHHEVDIALDSFPFGGLTTALQSLWMGVPTLTLPGATLPGRSGATVMGHAGLEQFIAHDAREFVQRGTALAADWPALAELRAQMRERCAASPMFRVDLVAQGVSEALRTMWRRWCDGLPAESFEVAQ